MSSTNYQEIIDEHKSLSSLIKDQEIGIFDKFSDLDLQDEGFKNFIADKYFNSFQKLYQENLNSKEEFKVTAVLRTVKFLANDEAQKKIVSLVCTTLKDSSNLLEELKGVMATKTGANEQLLAIGLVNNSLSHVRAGIINELGHHPEVASWRDKLLSNSLDICDSISRVKPSREEFKYVLYDTLVNNIGRIKNQGQLADRYRRHQGKIKGKKAGIEIKYVIGIVIFVILAIIKILNIIL